MSVPAIASASAKAGASASAQAGAKAGAPAKAQARDEENLHFAQRILNLPVLLFAVAFALAFLPRRMEDRARMSPIWALLVVYVFILAFFQYKLSGRPENRTAAKDVASVVFIFCIFWNLVTSKLDLFPFVFVPAPENVFWVYVEQWDYILSGLGRSMFLLVSGFFSSIIVAITLGIAVGWIPRLRNAVFPITKTISTVPALIYGPYIVAIMPTFTSASVLILFCGVFWSTFMNMINRVGTIDRRIIDTAKVLNVNTPTMIFRVILPYSLPRIINDMSVSLSISVMTLTAAENVGANIGMGRYVSRALAYANYTQAIAGIFFIAVVITILQYFVARLKKATVKWNY
ncbi:MAG: ABC transporter permease subunit [Lachnospiraceae bacterium]|nr:ABC transporter permease subunit [Lachnospiraceae bacterium]